jgi:hypothetical protein
MQMRVVMAGSASSLENDDVSDIEFHSDASVENVFETGVSCPHKRAEQFWIMTKPCSEELRHGQDHMAVINARQQPSSNEISPTVSINFSARQTKTGFAGEGNAANFSTVAASVLNKTHLFWITTAKHFLDGSVVIETVKFWMNLRKRIPMVVENLLECVFVNAFHGCPLRTTIARLT